jgi:hypothetical protein
MQEQWENGEGVRRFPRTTASNTLSLIPHVRAETDEDLVTTKGNLKLLYTKLAPSCSYLRQ